MLPIAHIRNGFRTKFAIPRQAGIARKIPSVIVFEPSYRAPEAVRGIEAFSHLWLIWNFSENERAGWSPTVRPPRLGGNKRVGVFATRSPFRPNPIGLSCVKLDSVEFTHDHGPLLRVSGADLMDGTPIFDIKPYLPFADCHPEATGGLPGALVGDAVEVYIPDNLLTHIPAAERETIREILAQDPRPAYQDEPDRIYGFPYGNLEIHFKVEGKHLEVVNVQATNS